MKHQALYSSKDKSKIKNKRAVCCNFACKVKVESQTLLYVSISACLRHIGTLSERPTLSFM